MTTKNKPGQGRKPLGEERGGLVRILVSIYRDQAEMLKNENASRYIREAIDKVIEGRNG